MQLEGSFLGVSAHVELTAEALEAFHYFQLSRTAQDHLCFFRSLSSVLLLSFELSVRKYFRCSCVYISSRFDKDIRVACGFLFF